MAQGNKFGTFGGVFTPAILTILGVIMYLRLPRIVGEGGLWLTVGIVLAAHMISVTTGLSVASIATDKKVEVGGPYYIVSRSLGLPIGGTLGLALFIGLSFSVSLYVIGFCESMLTYFGYEMSKDNIRIAGTITLFAVTSITLISTAFAIKIQYVIMAAIVLSLISILAGGPPTAPQKIHVEPMPTGASVEVLFGIFFPAVTGFTAGVNMSGDLRDPKRSLPRGTLAAIALGLVVYIGLTVFFAARFSPEQLTDPEMLTKFSWIPEFVVAGIWGATLSSAIGSILGAPRILQAKSIDRITPQVFARGRGKSNEPINALMLTFGIAEFGILIGELDIIAAIVSMFFIMTYGFLNVSCAVESWASPDFRPDFRIPRIVPIIGAVTCLLVMIQLDFLAMIGATAILSGLYMYFKRRELTLETGDTWEGVWSSVVRSGLARLSRGGDHRRNWRPNVLAFSGSAMPGGELEPAAAQLVRAVAGSRGVLTEFEMVPDKHDGQGRTQATIGEDMEALAARGVFQRRVPCQDPYDSVAGISRYFGFSGLEPNTVALPVATISADPERFIDLSKTFAELDFNVLMTARSSTYAGVVPQPDSAGKQVDVWWAPGRGNIGFAISLVGFVTLQSTWRRANLRFILKVDDRVQADVLYKATRRRLSEARLSSDVKVITASDSENDFYASVRAESRDANLVLVGLPSRLDAQEVAAIGQLGETLPLTLFVRAATAFESSDFDRKLVDSTPEGDRDAVTDREVATELEALHLPMMEGLDVHAEVFDDALRGLLDAFYERGVQHAHRADMRLFDKVAGLLDRQLSQAAKNLEGPVARQRKRLVRTTGALIFQARRIVDEFEELEVETLGDGIELGVEGVSAAVLELKERLPRHFVVTRSVDDFKASAADDGPSRRYKFRRRMRGRFGGGEVRMTIQVRALGAYYLDEHVCALGLEAYRAAARSQQRSLAAVEQALYGARTALEQVGRRLGEDALKGYITEEHRRLKSLLEQARETRMHAATKLRQEIQVQARDIANRFAHDLERVDIVPLMRRHRGVSREGTAALQDLSVAVERWPTNVRLRSRRVALAMAVTGVQHRLISIVTRARNNVAEQLRSGVNADYGAMVDGLAAFKEAVSSASADCSLRVSTDFRRRFDTERICGELQADVQQAVGHLPERLVTLSDEQMTALEADPFADPEVIEVSLRRMLGVLIETELLGPIQERIAKVPTVEHRAVGIAQDAVRLIRYYNEIDPEADSGAQTGMGDDLATVVETALERVSSEYEHLAALAPDIDALLASCLRRVLERSHVYAATGGTDGQFALPRGGSDTVLSGVGRATRDFRERVREVLFKQWARLLYRRNAGLVSARRIRDVRRHQGTVDPMLALMGQTRPPTSLVERIPFYYRQLFTGKTTIGNDFWVGREQELTICQRAIDHYRDGYRGALVVVGERDSGKSALCQFMARRFFGDDNVFNVYAPAGGSTGLDELRRRVETELKRSGSLDEVLASLPATSVVVFHDLELWWERSGSGTLVIERLLELVDRHSDDVLFVFNLNSTAYRYLERVTRIGERALATVTCQPMMAEELAEVVLKRHRSTGISFRLEGRSEEELSDFRIARLFTALFETSRGNVGATLKAWIAHVERVEGDTLCIRKPRPVVLDAFDGISGSALALLVQFVLHKQLTTERLVRLTGQEASVVAADVGALERMGAVVEVGEGVLELDRWSHAWVTFYLADRRVISTP